MSGVSSTIGSKVALTRNLNKFKGSDVFFPKSFLLNNEESFSQEFSLIAAESILKASDGKFTIQTLVALNITEQRLLSQESKEPLINDAQKEILKMSKLEVM